MRIALICRSIFLLAWLALLLAHRGIDSAALLLTVGLVAVWAAPMVRDTVRSHAAHPEMTPRSLG